MINTKEIETATLEAIYWWNRDESYYHNCFANFDNIYKDKAMLEFFTTKIFEVFLREYSIRRNLSAGHENVNKFIDERLCCMNPRLRQTIPFPFKGQATLTDFGAAI